VEGKSCDPGNEGKQGIKMTKKQKEKNDADVRKTRRKHGTKVGK